VELFDIAMKHLPEYADGKALHGGMRAKLSVACYFIMLKEQPLSPMMMNN